MYSYVICVSFVCTRMSSLCNSHLLVCQPHATGMYSYVIRVSQVFLKKVEIAISQTLPPSNVFSDISVPTQYQQMKYQKINFLPNNFFTNDPISLGDQGVSRAHPHDNILFFVLGSQICLLHGFT